MAGRGNILIGISGGIAAYKSLSLIRLFIKAGYQVKVVATSNALKFITPLSIETLSKNKVYSDVFNSPEEYSTEHISIGEFADVFVIAPATANVIGKFVAGIADDALSTTFLAFDKPVFIAPAMNTKMMHHYSVERNLNILKKQGVHFIESTSGELACGTYGDGRMEEPEQIFESVDLFLNGKKSLEGKKALVTAGPTVELIDPVRYISNYSSGKMGIAIADELKRRGASVTLVCGPIHQKTDASIHRIDVTTAAEMHQKCTSLQSEMDIIVMAAAVADYTPTHVSTSKIKKSDTNLTIKLSKTKDILYELGTHKPLKQLLVGFALETENGITHAQEKLHRKNLDFIVLNSLSDTGAGFGVDTNKITIIDNLGNCTSFPLKSKIMVAKDIVDIIEKK